MKSNLVTNYSVCIGDNCYGFIWKGYHVKLGLMNVITTKYSFQHLLTPLLLNVRLKPHKTRVNSSSRYSNST